MASLNFEIESRNFIEWHAKSYPTLRAAEKTYRNLLHLLLSSVETLPPPKITSRLKDRDECIKKFQRKYQSNLELKGNDYKIKDHITDIIGIRIICLYESNIDVVVDKLKSNFKVVGESNKTKELQSEDDKFGYKGQHFDLELNDERESLPEYEKLKEFSFEVQIRTIAQDAWSEIDHKLKYKKDLPKKLKRRVYNLAGLFELADREFDLLREETTIFATAELEKNENDNPIMQQLNPFNFLNLANRYYSSYHFNEEHIEEFVDDIRHVKSDVTINEVENAMKNHHKKIGEYRSWCIENAGKNLNPYTEIRHVLYLSNKDNFDGIMFDIVKKRFNLWIDEGTTLKKT